MQTFVQMEFDFSFTRDYSAETTVGFGDRAKAVVRFRLEGTKGDVLKALGTYAEKYAGRREPVGLHDVGGKTVVDFGSHVYFGRVSPCLR